MQVCPHVDIKSKCIHKREFHAQLSILITAEKCNDFHLLVDANLVVRVLQSLRRLNRIFAKCLK